MSFPSDDIIVIWILESLETTDWVEIQSRFSIVLRQKIASLSLEECQMRAESKIHHIDTAIRNKISIDKSAGHHCPYEVSETDRYIKRTLSNSRESLRKLQTMNPTHFENYCAAVVKKLGGSCISNGGKNDGGIDFFSNNVSIVCNAAPFPATSKVAIVGQAKRYKDGNLVSLNEVRQFVGASMRFVNEKRANGQIAALSPVLLAMWTSNSFHPEASEYCRKIGVWEASGETLLQLAQFYGINFEEFF